jgi:PAS domain S-box-containing protein
MLFNRFQWLRRHGFSWLTASFTSFPTHFRCDCPVAEETLRRAEARNRAVLKAIPDLVFRLNRDGVFLDYHARMEDELYIPSGEIVGKNIRENMPPDFAELVLENIHATLESGEVQMFEYSLPFENGLRSYEARMSVSGADEVVAIVRDISERRRAEEKLRRSEENLRRITDNMLDLVS